MLARVFAIATCPSVCLSVRPSVRPTVGRLIHVYLLDSAAGRISFPNLFLTLYTIIILNLTLTVIYFWYSETVQCTCSPACWTHPNNVAVAVTTTPAMCGLRADALADCNPPHIPDRRVTECVRIDRRTTGTYFSASQTVGDNTRLDSDHDKLFK